MAALNIPPNVTAKLKNKKVNFFVETNQSNNFVTTSN
jgi:hypothetical protein